MLTNTRYFQSNGNCLTESCQPGSSLSHAPIFINGEVRVGVGLRILINKSAYARTAHGTTKILSQLGTQRPTGQHKHKTAKYVLHRQDNTDTKNTVGHSPKQTRRQVWYSTGTKNRNTEWDGMPAWDLSTASHPSPWGDSSQKPCSHQLWEYPVLRRNCQSRRRWFQSPSG